MYILFVTAFYPFKWHFKQFECLRYSTCVAITHVSYINVYISVTYASGFELFTSGFVKRFLWSTYLYHKVSNTYSRNIIIWQNVMLCHYFIHCCYYSIVRNVSMVSEWGLHFRLSVFRILSCQRDEHWWNCTCMFRWHLVHRFVVASRARGNRAFSVVYDTGTRIAYTCMW